MSKADAYYPIDCDDYDYLELACQRHLTLTIHLREGEIIEGKACDIFSRKGVEYLLVEKITVQREIRLDHIYSFTHASIGTITIRYDDEK